MKYTSGLLALALAGTLSSAAYAADLYIGASGSTVTVEEKGERYEVVFHSGKKILKADGAMSRGKLVLDRYADDVQPAVPVVAEGEQQKVPEEVPRNPGVVMNFLDSMVHVSVQRDSEWYRSGIEGGYQKLDDYETVVSGIKEDSPQFAAIVQKMDDAFERLLKTEPEQKQAPLKEAQEKWCDDSNQYIQTHILQDGEAANFRLTQKIEHAYEVLLTERTRFIEDVVRQKETRTPQTYLGTVRYREDSPQDLEFMPEGRHQAIPLCRAADPACREAVKLLGKHREAYVSLKARIDFAKGFIPEKMQIKKAHPPVAKPSTGEEEAAPLESLPQETAPQVKVLQDDGQMEWNGSD